MCLTAHNKLIVLGWFVHDFLSVRNHNVVEISNHIATLLLNLAVVSLISAITGVKL